LLFWRCSPAYYYAGHFDGARIERAEGDLRRSGRDRRRREALQGGGLPAFDWVPAPRGAGILMGYHQFATHSELTNTITGAVKNSHLDSHIGIARYLYYDEAFGHPFVLDLILPFGALTHGRIGGNPTGPSNPSPGLVLERLCVADIRRHVGGPARDANRIGVDDAPAAPLHAEPPEPG